jgi:N-methylhydantoinase A/oxoprolinase/acetone carboxylase beta subunit
MLVFLSDIIERAQEPIQVQLAIGKADPLQLRMQTLFLGILVPDFFPSIFGPHANESLDLDVVKRMFKEMTMEIKQGLGVKLTRGSGSSKRFRNQRP